MNGQGVVETGSKSIAEEGADHVANTVGSADFFF